MIEIQVWNDNILNYCLGNGREEKPGEIFVAELDDRLRKGEEKSERTHKFCTWETTNVVTPLTEMG